MHTVHKQITDMLSQWARDRRADLASDNIAETGDWRADLDWQILQGGYCLDQCPALGIVGSADILPRIIQGAELLALAESIGMDAALQRLRP